METTRDEKPIMLGTIGDVNPLDYGGGFVMQDPISKAAWIEWFEPEDEEDENSEIRVYRTGVQFPEWANLANVARSAGVDEAELREDLESEDALRAARALWSVVGHYGWHEFDHYSFCLPREEADERIAAL